MNRGYLVAGVACLTLAGGAETSRGDIAPSPQYGQSLTPFPATEVRMEAERVTITLARDRATVHASFDLVNDGPAVRMTIGFPDTAKAARWSSDPDVPPEGPASPKLRDFRARVDREDVTPVPRWSRQIEDPVRGPPMAEAMKKAEEALRTTSDPVLAERLRLSLEVDRRRARWWQMLGWLLWETAFEAGQRRTVDVDYWVPWQNPRRPGLLGEQSVDYILCTGALWKGPIGRAVIEVRFAGGFSPRHVTKLSPQEHHRTEAGFQWDWSDLEPTDDIRIEARQYADEPEAGAGYRARAEAAARAGFRGEEAWCLASACESFLAAGRAEDALAVARRILAFEAAERKGTSDAPGREHPVSRKERGVYEPWEIVVVRTLLVLGRQEEAREAAREALPRLRDLLANPPQGPLRADADFLRATIEAYLGFVEGGPVPK